MRLRTPCCLRLALSRHIPHPCSAPPLVFRCSPFWRCLPVSALSPLSVFFRWGAAGVVVAFRPRPLASLRSAWELQRIKELAAPGLRRAKIRAKQRRSRSLPARYNGVCRGFVFSLLQITWSRVTLVGMPNVKLGELLSCPCGSVPTALNLLGSSQGGKWALASGNCCGEWFVEFRTDYHSLDSSDCMSLAVTSWNLSPRPNPK